MKKLILLVFTVFAFSGAAYGQFTFGVNPGTGLSGANFGYQFGNLVPYVGLQYYGGGMTYEESGYEYDYNTQTLVKYSDKYEGSISVYMPYIGAKYFINQTANIKPYINASIFKPMLFASAEYNGEEEQDVKNTVDNISIWGFEAGFGTEYFFDKNFSLGGEFGLRLLYTSSDYSEDYEVYNPDIDDYVMTKRTYDMGLNLGMTYAKFSLNYYFGD